MTELDNILGSYRHLWPNPFHIPIVSKKELSRRATQTEMEMIRSHEWYKIPGPLLICLYCKHKWHCQGFKPSFYCPRDHE